MMTDPIADMLARLRNAQAAGHKQARIPASKLKRAILDVLRTQGYVGEVTLVTDAAFPTLQVELKYVAETQKPVISQLKRVSTPGLRRYCGCDELPRVRDGLGVAVVSTSKGVMSDADARAQRLGGEVLCTVF